MTIRETIEQLEAIAKEHGDNLPVCTACEDVGESETLPREREVTGVDFSPVKTSANRRSEFGVIIG